MDSTRDIRTTWGGRLACSTVTPPRERDDRCLSLRRKDRRSDKQRCMTTTWLRDRLRLIVARRCWFRPGTGRKMPTYATDEHATLRMKWEKWNMKRYKFKHLPIQSNLLLQYFVTNMHKTNLPGVNSKDLSESFRLITTKFFFSTTSLLSLIWYVFMFLSLRSVAHWRRATLLLVFTEADASDWRGPKGP